MILTKLPKLLTSCIYVSARSSAPFLKRKQTWNSKKFPNNLHDDYANFIATPELGEIELGECITKVKTGISLINKIDFKKKKNIFIQKKPSRPSDFPFPHFKDF